MELIILSNSCVACKARHDIPSKKHSYKYLTSETYDQTTICVREGLNRGWPLHVKTTNKNARLELELAMGNSDDSV